MEAETVSNMNAYTSCSTIVGGHRGGGTQHEDEKS